jgi:myo-inositol-1(or 4)-monophosphatase
MPRWIRNTWERIAAIEIGREELTGKEHSGALERRDGAGSAAPLSPAALLAHLRVIYDQVRDYLLREGWRHTESVGKNAKGDVTRGFDAAADRLAVEYCRTHLAPCHVFAEESGEAQWGDAPQWTLVFDPCDGSNNFRRGLRAAGFAAAALPGAGLLDPDRVTVALVGDIFTGSCYTAMAGQGAQLDGHPIHTSTVTDLNKAIVGTNLSRAAARQGNAGGGVLQLLSRVSAARRSGSTVLDLCYVAQGALEGYVDVRERLTPENFLAPALIIREAGGCFTNSQGLPLGPVEFIKPYNIVAAGNGALLAGILAALQGG